MLFSLFLTLTCFYLLEGSESFSTPFYTVALIHFKFTHNTPFDFFFINVNKKSICIYHILKIAIDREISVI